MRSAHRRRLQRLADYAIPWGVGLFLFLVVGEEVSGDRTPSSLYAASVVLAVVQGAALRWRRTNPEPVMAVTLVAGLAFQLIAPDVVLPIAGFFAIFSLAALRSPRVSLVGLAGLVGLAATNFFTTNTGDTVFAMAVAVGCWALGEAARNRRVAIREEARRAVSEEQGRIARELHDVIAHSVSLIVVQAAAADDVFDERPDQARAALRAIERAGRDALGELRRLLSAVASRRGGGPGRSAAGSGAPRRARRAAARRRSRGCRAPRGPGRCFAGRRRAVGIPHRPGGPHATAPARARHTRRGDAALRTGSARSYAIR